MGEKDLAERLLELSPESPLSPSDARPLVADALLADVSELPAGRAFALAGVASGREVAPAWDVPERSSAQRTSRRNIPGGHPRAACASDGVGSGASSAQCTSRRNIPGGHPRAVVAIGAFDGVHAGHRSLVARARAEAERRGDELVVVTFSPDPADVLVGERAPRALLSTENRQRALLALPGVDRLVVLDFTAELAALPYDAFVREVLGALVELDCIVVGSDFNLGAGGAGTVAALSELGRDEGFDVIGMGLLDDDGEPVSATRIRGLVSAGRVEAAAALLGRCHRVAGKVVHGRGEGTGFGFPTANVRVPEGLLLPAEGVYAGYVSRGGAAWPAAVNVGAPRTFSSDERGTSFLEATLLGFTGDLYGADVDVVFLRWLREPRVFDSVEELERVVLGNVDWVRKSLGERCVRLGSTS